MTFAEQKKKKKKKKKEEKKTDQTAHPINLIIDVGRHRESKRDSASSVVFS